MAVKRVTQFLSRLFWQPEDFAGATDNELSNIAQNALSNEDVGVTASASASAFVAATSAGSPTVQLTTRTLTIGDKTVTVLTLE